MKVGDEIQTFAEIEGIFAENPDVHRIQAERRAERRYVITVMDDQRPNDLKKIAQLNLLPYERNAKRRWESVRSYHIPTDTMRYVFYRLSEEAWQS